MKKVIIGFFAIFFQLFGIMFYMAAAPDYGFTMMATFINELIAFLLYFWLFTILKSSKTILLKFGMGSSAALGLLGLVSYFDIRGFFG